MELLELNLQHSIPCILANHSRYDHLGFTYKPKSKVRYNNLLNNIKNIKTK